MTDELLEKMDAARQALNAASTREIVAFGKMTRARPGSTEGKWLMGEYEEAKAAMYAASAHLIETIAEAMEQPK